LWSLVEPSLEGGTDQAQAGVLLELACPDPQAGQRVGEAKPMDCRAMSQSTRSRILPRRIGSTRTTSARRIDCPTQAITRRSANPHRQRSTII
jgi:hypothetical protein